MFTTVQSLYDEITAYRDTYPEVFRYSDCFSSQLDTIKRLIKEAEKNHNLEKRDTLLRIAITITKYREALQCIYTEKGKTLSFSTEEFTWLVYYLDNLINDTSQMIDDTVYEYLQILHRAKALSMLDREDEIIMLWLILKAFERHTYYWRAREQAEKLIALLEEQPPDSAYYEQSVEAYRAIAAFYNRVKDAMRAYHFAKKGAELALKNGDLSLSADLLYTALRYTNVLPECMRPSVDEKEIQSVYGDYANGILRYPRTSWLAVDPIEHTEAFLNAFDNVMEDTMTELNRVGDLHDVHQLWMIMSNEFARRDIVWRDPQQMNPRCTFS